MSDYSYIPPIVKEFTFALDIADVVKAVSDFCRQKYWILEKFSDIRYTAHSRSTAYSLRSRVMLASDCHLEIVGRPISKTTRITAQSLECSQDFADHYPASLHRYHACVDSLLAHLADFEITPDLGPPLAQPKPEPVKPTDDKKKSNGRLYTSKGKPLLEPGQMTVGEYAKTPEGKEWFAQLWDKIFRPIQEMFDNPDNKRFLNLCVSLENSPDVRLQAIGKMLMESPIEHLPAMSQRHLELMFESDIPQLPLIALPPIKPADDVTLARPTMSDDPKNKGGKPRYKADEWARAQVEGGAQRRDIRAEWQKRRQKEMEESCRGEPADWDDTFRKVFTLRPENRKIPEDT